MKRILLQLLLLLSLALPPALLANYYHPRRPEPPRPLLDTEITAATARQLQGKILWIDPRPVSQFNRRHISGALRLTQEEWEPLFEKIIDAWRPGQRIVIYCDRRHCPEARELAERFRRESGLNHIYTLRGGWQAWHSLAR